MSDAVVLNRPAVPRVRFQGRWWSSDEVEANASRWRAEILESLGDRPLLAAAVIPATPDGVAMIAVLTSLPHGGIVLAPDESAWRTEPPLREGTIVALPPAMPHLASAVRALGCVPMVLSERPRNGSAQHPVPLLEGQGVTLFTSGSTGNPKAVYRTLAARKHEAHSRADALGLQSGDGIMTGVSLAHGHGFNRVLLAMLLRSPFGIVDPIDYRDALAAFSSGEFALWSATTHFADVLGRCALTGPAIAPRRCLVSTPIAQRVFDAFYERYGVPLRQNYSSTETGHISIDTRPDEAVRPDSVGLPVKDVAVHIGPALGTPPPEGESGRIWVRTPWQMLGYGYPPHLERPGSVGEWWPTQDMGSWEPDGCLKLAGRIDDCIRTREGRLVNLAFIANSLRGSEGISEVAVVALPDDTSVAFGAVLECEEPVTLAEVRAHIAETLPRWAWPRSLAIVQTLPRLPNGKIDRRSCLEVLRRQH